MSAVARLRRCVGRGAAAVIRRLPERFSVALLGRYLGYSMADIPRPIEVPDGEVRLLIGPVNFAGQGYQWARAARTTPGFGAIAMQYRGTEDLGFPVDYEVPTSVFVYSRRFARDHWQAVRGFTHVLVEAERSILGSRFGGDLRREVAALRDSGVRVSMLVHGSDLRLPSRHRETEPWSPFTGEWDDYVATLEAQATANLALLAELDVPVLVSTPDMLDFWPAAEWLPVVIEPARWATGATCLERERPIVVHAPSRSRIKGTDLIERQLRELDAEGLIEYREVSGVPAERMPDIYRGADIVLDQFRIGNYGVAAVEAMAAGRLVISHVSDSVRERAAAEAAMALPIVEATGDTIVDVLRDVLNDRESARIIASRGPEFAARLHDGRRSVQVLARVCDFPTADWQTKEGEDARW